MHRITVIVITIVFLVIMWCSIDTQTVCYKPAAYILVIHLPTGKCFVLSKSGYLLDNTIVLTEVCEIKKGWLPDLQNQIPAWVKEYEKKDFNAYFLY